MKKYSVLHAIVKRVQYITRFLNLLKKKKKNQSLYQQDINQQK